MSEERREQRLSIITEDASGGAARRAGAGAGAEAGDPTEVRYGGRTRTRTRRELTEPISPLPPPYVLPEAEKIEGGERRKGLRDVRQIARRGGWLRLALLALVVIAVVVGIVVGCVVGLRKKKGHHG